MCWTKLIQIFHQDKAHLKINNKIKMACSMLAKIVQLPITHSIITNINPYYLQAHNLKIEELVTKIREVIRVNNLTTTVEIWCLWWDKLIMIHLIQALIQEDQLKPTNNKECHLLVIKVNELVLWILPLILSNKILVTPRSQWVFHKLHNLKHKTYLHLSNNKGSNKQRFFTLRDMQPERKETISKLLIFTQRP